MMISFLAHIEGGVSQSEEETTKITGATERLLKGRAGVKAKLFHLLDGEVSAEGSAQQKNENVVESKTERQHTAVSLFNILYDYLTESEQVINLSNVTQLDSVPSGTLVEIAGRYIGNPYEEILALADALYPYIQERNEALINAVKGATHRRPPSANKKPAQGQAAPAVQLPEALEKALSDLQDIEQQINMKIAMRMASDIKSSPVHDLLLSTGESLKVVATVSSEFYSRTTSEYLRSGDFRVIGKVTRILREGETINLARRTIMGATGAENTTAAIEMSQATGLQLEAQDPLVHAPAVQVLPMAIFL